MTRLVDQYFDFLDDETRATLRDGFERATWIKGDQQNHRKALICIEWDGFALFLERAAERLALFRRPVFEIQLTRMGDGGFLASHQDAQYGADDDAALTTFVYYLGDRASFTGGRLLIGDEVVDPVDNSLVLFDGLRFHSIEWISGRGAQRLTINGCYKERFPPS